MAYTIAILNYICFFRYQGPITYHKIWLCVVQVRIFITSFFNTTSGWNVELYLGREAQKHFVDNGEEINVFMLRKWTNE